MQTYMLALGATHFTHKAAAPCAIHTDARNKIINMLYVRARCMDLPETFLTIFLTFLRPSLPSLDLPDLPKCFLVYPLDLPDFFRLSLDLPYYTTPHQTFLRPFMDLPREREREIFLTFPRPHRPYAFLTFPRPSTLIFEHAKEIIFLRPDCTQENERALRKQMRAN